MSQIYIRNLVVEAKHGVHAHEKLTPQKFDITIEIDVNTPSAFKSDEFEDTISYSELRQQVINVTQNNSFSLIERLAQEIIDTIFVDERMEKISVTIEKLDVYADTVPGIKVTQSR